MKWTGETVSGMERMIERLTGGAWFELGTHANGNVDVCDPEKAVFENVSPETAKALIAARNAFLESVRVALEPPTDYLVLRLGEGTSLSTIREYDLSGDILITPEVKP